MMRFAKLSTAITIPFGPVLDSAGAEYTGAVVGDVKISKNNGTPAALNGSATLTHREVGVYELALTTSDISAVGFCTVTLSKTTYIAPPVSLVIMPAKVYDSLIGGTDNLETDVVQLLGTAWLTPGTAGTPDVNVKLISGDATAADNAEAFFDGTGYAGTNNVIPTVTAVTGSVGSVTGAVGSVTGAVGSVTGNVTVGTIAANAVNASALDADAATEIADAILKRDWTSVTGEAARSVLNALRMLRNKWSVSAGTLTVTKEDDSTSAWTAAVTSDAAADPITGSDPA